jgi:hypothetical protein
VAYERNDKEVPPPDFRRRRKVVPLDLLSMKLPKRNKVEVEMEPAEEMSDIASEDMGPEEEGMESSPLAQFEDSELLDECKKRGII